MSDADYAEMLIAGVVSPGGGRVTDVYTPVESSGLAPCLSSSLSKSWAGKTTCFCENSLCSQFYHYSLSLHSLFASIPWSGSP